MGGRRNGAVRGPGIGRPGKVRLGSPQLICYILMLPCRCRIACPFSPFPASIDQLRGTVMLLMLLDHVRETFFLQHQVSDPMDAATVSPALFACRLLAHLCAPSSCC